MSVLLILCACIAFVYCEFEENVVVNLDQGILSGKVEQTVFNNKRYYGFYGIPYAAPPIGDLRFLPPQPPKPWDGTYEAHELKPTCLQASIGLREGEDRGISGSEDCLYLNIFTPSLDQSLPVIVFDHNSDFRTSFNGSKTYSPDFFIEEDVVIVYVNYRLDILGFLTTGDDVIPANAGVRDFILGLEWIQEHIDKFGGNKNKVTLMGHEGGSVLVNLLLYTKKAQGLFNSIISQSGSAFETIYFPSNPKENAFAVGKVFKIDTEDSKELLKQLQALEANDLLANVPKIYEHIKNAEKLIFSPSIEIDTENAIFTDLPETSKIINDVPVLIGYTSRIGLEYIKMFLYQPQLIKELHSFFDFHLPVRTDFKFDKNSSIYEKAEQEVREMYFKDGLLFTHNFLDYAVYMGDVYHKYPTEIAVSKFTEDMNSPVFYYEFDYYGSLNQNIMAMSKRSYYQVSSGATITDELCYLQYCPKLELQYNKLRKLLSEQPELKTIKKMVRLWSNFAKYGNPSPNTEDKVLRKLKWEPVSKNTESKKYLHISSKLSMKENPLGKRAEFWDNFIQKYSKMAIDGVVSHENIRDEL